MDRRQQQNKRRTVMFSEIQIQTVMHFKNIKRFSAALFLDMDAFDKVWQWFTIFTLTFSYHNATCSFASVWTLVCPKVHHPVQSLYFSTSPTYQFNKHPTHSYHNKIQSNLQTYNSIHITTKYSLIYKPTTPFISQQNTV